MWIRLRLSIFSAFFHPILTPPGVAGAHQKNPSLLRSEGIPSFFLRFQAREAPIQGFFEAAFIGVRLQKNPKIVLSRPFIENH